MTCGLLDSTEDLGTSQDGALGGSWYLVGWRRWADRRQHCKDADCLLSLASCFRQLLA